MVTQELHGQSITPAMSLAILTGMPWGGGTLDPPLTCTCKLGFGLTTEHLTHKIQQVWYMR